MSYLIDRVLNSPEKANLSEFFTKLQDVDNRYLLKNEIIRIFNDFCQQPHNLTLKQSQSALNNLIEHTQEIILEPESLCIIIRPKIAHGQVFRIYEDLTYEEITVPELLDIRDRFVGLYAPEEGDVFEIDFNPFYDYTPTIKDAKNIGKGVDFLNRYLSSKLFQDPRQWLEALYNFLSLHQHNGITLLINGRIKNRGELSEQVKQAISLVSSLPASQDYETFRYEFQELGFEPGWGNNAQRVRETLELLDELLDSPDDEVLEAFMSRIPMIFRIVLVSVHGWITQDGGLGKPDTGGQAVYVIDQARSLAYQLEEDIRLAGLAGLEVKPQVIVLTRLIPNSEGTRCHEVKERIYGTDYAWILRVPFRQYNQNMTNNWISRFEIWPYLETFAIDAEKEILAELQGKPDLIIGNYSDGNLVAFLLARKLKVTQFHIAHALEKSKYLFSNLYWQDLEFIYHFSLQFTADLIAMNAANCIVSSTYQEISGTPESVGQYESYVSFTMPGLYHVVKGIELFSPKFNVVPPGINEYTYFPYTNHSKRVVNRQEKIEDLLFKIEDGNLVFGRLEEPDKIPIFTMGRLNRIKNISGLVECFGESKELQEKCNLIVIAGKLLVSDAFDHEEREDIEKIYYLIDRYDLYHKIRWSGIRLSKGESGEIYRVIADHQGIFIQPALFEPFGLTILEAMISGLPTFATQFGGPLEIIQDGVNGFYINPTNYAETAAKILKFLGQCESNPDYWHQISRQAIARVKDNYTWQLHTTKLLSLARNYGFWNFTSKENREDLLRYVEALFHLIYKPKAQELLNEHYRR
jgi:sucrose synthase